MLKQRKVTNTGSGRLETAEEDTWDCKRSYACWIARDSVCASGAWVYLCGCSQFPRVYVCKERALFTGVSFASESRRQSLCTHACICACEFLCRRAHVRELVGVHEAMYVCECFQRHVCVCALVQVCLRADTLACVGMHASVCVCACEVSVYKGILLFPPRGERPKTGPSAGRDIARMSSVLHPFTPADGLAHRGNHSITLTFKKPLDTLTLTDGHQLCPESKEREVFVGWFRPQLCRRSGDRESSQLARIVNSSQALGPTYSRTGPAVGSESLLHPSAGVKSSVAARVDRRKSFSLLLREDIYTQCHWA